MGFTYQEKRGRTRKHGTPDPVLEKGEKGGLGERKPGILAVGQRNEL